jgi:hypothetical protein
LIFHKRPSRFYTIYNGSNLMSLMEYQIIIKLYKI